MKHAHSENVVSLVAAVIFFKFFQESYKIRRDFVGCFQNEKYEK